MLVPIQVIAFPHLATHQRTEAASVFNLVRSVCSSVGVSVTLTLFVTSSAVSRATLVEHVTPYSLPLQLGPVAEAFDLASAQALAILEQEIERQAAMIAYNADFLFLAAAAVAALPVLLFVGRARIRGAPDREGEAFAIAE